MDAAITEEVVKQEVIIIEEVPVHFEYDSILITKEDEFKVPETSDRYPEELKINDNKSKDQSHPDDHIPLKNTNISNGKEEIIQLKERYQVENIEREPCHKALNTNKVTTGVQLTKELKRGKSLSYRNSPYKCEKCYKGFVGLRAYDKHKEKHGENDGKPYSCTYCEYRCSRNGDMIKHLRKHTGEKPYSCTLCEYKSTENGALISHMRKHTGEKPFSCTLCEYKCSLHGSLIRHLRKHTGEKPYSCSKCKFKCSESGKLVIHMRRHTGEKPYLCKHCDYSCTQSGSLIIHLRKHTGEKPYVCKHCGFKFSHKGNLMRHLKKHVDD